MDRHQLLNDALGELQAYGGDVARIARQSALSRAECDTIQAQLERMTAALERYRIANFGN